MLRRLEQVINGLADLGEKWGGPNLLASIRRARAMPTPEEAVDEQGSPGRRARGWYTRGPKVIESVPTNARAITALLAGKQEAQQALHHQASEPGAWQMAVGKFSTAVERFSNHLNRSFNPPGPVATVAQDVAGLTMAQRIRRLRDLGRPVASARMGTGGGMRSPEQLRTLRQLDVEEAEAEEQRDRDAAGPAKPAGSPWSVRVMAGRAARWVAGRPYAAGSWLGGGMARALGAPAGGAVAGAAGAVGGAAGVALGAVAGIAALGVAAVKAVQGLERFADSATESSRGLSPYHATFSVGFARLDFAKMQMQFRMAEQTQATFRPLLEATIRMQRAAQPLSGDWQNLTNRLGTVAADLATGANQFMNWVMQGTGLRDALRGPQAGPDVQPWIGPQWVMAGFASRAHLNLPGKFQPMNRRPGE